MLASSTDTGRGCATPTGRRSTQPTRRALPAPYPRRRALLPHIALPHVSGTRQSPVLRGQTGSVSLQKWCDDYFAIPARAERRGVGGIFFDDLSEGGGGGAAAVAPSDAGRFTRDVGEARQSRHVLHRPRPAPSGRSPHSPTNPLLLSLSRSAFPSSPIYPPRLLLSQALAASYLPIIDRRRALPFSAAQRTWQLQRRGRYLEFNLLYDRGVRFGLTGGRFESVMVSAPPLIRWDYNVAPAEGTEEARLVAELRREPARDWAAAES